MVSGEEKTVAITLHNFPADDLAAYVIVPFILAFLFLGLSLWIFGMRRFEAAGRAFALFASSLAIVLGTFFDIYSTHVFFYLWTVGLAVTGGALINLALTFPQELHIITRAPYLRWIGYAAGLGLAAYAIFTFSIPGTPPAYFTGWRHLYPLMRLQSCFILE